MLHLVWASGISPTLMSGEGDLPKRFQRPARQHKAMKCKSSRYEKPAASVTSFFFEAETSCLHIAIARRFVRLLHRFNHESIDACWEAGIDRMQEFNHLREVSDARSCPDRVQDLLGPSFRRHRTRLIKPSRFLVAEGQAVRVEPSGHLWRTTHHHCWRSCAVGLHQLGAQ